jgi:putative NADH-flavin reductase
MKLILFGATGTVGAGALREALADSGVDEVPAISRRACGDQHRKFGELLLPEVFDVAAVAENLSGMDACIWGAGISARRPRRNRLRQGHRGTDPVLGSRGARAQSQP